MNKPVIVGQASKLVTHEQKNETYCSKEYSLRLADIVGSLSEYYQNFPPHQLAAAGNAYNCAFERFEGVRDLEHVEKLAMQIYADNEKMLGYMDQ